MDIGALQCGAENVARKLCVDKGAMRVCLGMKVCGEGVSCEALAGVSVRAARRVHGGACSAGLRVWSARPQFEAVLHSGVSAQRCRCGQGLL